MAPLAAVNRGFSKKRMSSIGLEECSSHNTKAPSTTAPTANAVSVAGRGPPLVGASMTPQRKVARPTIDSRAPTGSSLGADGSRESGTRNQPPTRATMTIGTLTRNTDPH